MVWCLVHLRIHVPRGWPWLERRGEWDFLMTAVAMGAGEPPDAILGAVHGFELGSYLVAALVAIPVALGADPTASVRVLAMLLGAVFVGAVVWLSSWFAVRLADWRRAARAVGVMGLVLALGWPGLHMEFEGLSGNTVESFVLQLLAAALVVTAPSAPGWRRPLAVGFLLGLAGLFSPVAAWSAGAVGLVGLVLTDGWGARARVLGLAVAGGLSPFIAFAVLAPGGVGGIEHFLWTYLEAGGPGPDGSSAPGLAVVGKVGEALVGPTVNEELWLRDGVLAGVGWSLVAALAFVGVRGGSDPDITRRLRAVALLAASWALPVMRLPEDLWLYPLAFRYWLFGIALAFVLLPVALLHLGRGGAVVGGALVVAALACVPSLPRTIIHDIPSRAQALVGAAAHSMGPRRGRDRHEQYLAVAPHLRPQDRPALAEGYGMHLGMDFVTPLEGSPPAPWLPMAEALPPELRTRFLVGVGCGMSIRPLTDASLAAVRQARAELAAPVWWGLGRCSTSPALDEHLGVPAFDAGRAERVYEGAHSALREPWMWMPPRPE